MTQPIYLTTPEIAKRIGLTAGTLAKMRRRPGAGPPFVRLSGRRIVYAAASVDEWMREREFRSTQEYASAAA
jgi:predicted DNA-binding transcriptional regulator AlpA